MSVNILVHGLRSIRAGKPINLQKFKRALDLAELDSTLVKGHKVKGQNYIVTWIDDDLLESLSRYDGYDDSTRELAAEQNKSHSKNVSGSWLIVRNSHGAFNVIAFDKHGNYCFENDDYKHAIIIENRQNFLSLEQMKPFLVQKCELSQELIADTLFIFSDGNQISNKLHQSFLARFKKLYLLVDVDIGGMIIADNLSRLLPNAELEFVMPSDITQRLSNVLIPLSDSELSKALELADKNNLLANVASVIRKTRRTIEQESYLNE